MTTTLRALVASSLLILLSPQTQAQESLSPASHTLRIVAVVPEGTPPLYIAGTHPLWGPWKPDLCQMTGEGKQRETTITLPAGEQVEFKFTLGSWATQAQDKNGRDRVNELVRVNSDMIVTYKIDHFKQTPETLWSSIAETGLVGKAELIPNVPSKHLKNTRSIVVWTPTDYATDTDRRYPVIYMQDGQLLFDPRVPMTRIDWSIDDTLVRLINEKTIEPVIVVAIFHSDSREAEYSVSGTGPEYSRFVVEEVKPMIDARYRTKPDKEHTAIMGASRGGLIAFYTALQYPQVFGKAACFSPFYTDDAPWLQHLELGEGTRPTGQQFYFDYGLREPAVTGFPQSQQRINAMLSSWGWKQGQDFIVYEDPTGLHEETSWRTRFAQPVKAFFGVEKGG